MSHDEYNDSDNFTLDSVIYILYAGFPNPCWAAISLANMQNYFRKLGVSARWLTFWVPKANKFGNIWHNAVTLLKLEIHTLIQKLDIQVKF